MKGSRPCASLLLHLVIHLAALLLASGSDDHFVNSLLNQTFSGVLPVLPERRAFVPRNRSFVLENCFSIANHENVNRIGCCSAKKMKHVYNVLFENNRMVLFSDQPGLLPKALPPILSYRMRQEFKFSMPVEVRQELFDPSKHCKEYFPGTLHVVKRSTAHNIYHSVSDNYMVLVATMLLDGYLAPDMLFQPRRLLVDYHASLFNSAGPQGYSESEWGAPHMRLIRDIMSDGVVTPSRLAGTCYRRVVWGSEPHSNYLVALQTLRRQIATFSRLLANYLTKRALAAPNPPVWATKDHFVRSVDLPTSKAKALVNGSSPIKVVLFTRGTSGHGRSIANEQLLVDTLLSRGAAVFYCCDFSQTSLEEQLHVVLQADVVLGLHGAALVHGLFMAPGSITLEMKTLYAYESILFFVIADARSGIHGQVDIRKYFINNPGHRPVDEPLAARMMAALDAALAMRSARSCKESDLLRATNPAMAGDFVAASQCASPAFSHILGPFANDSYAICERMVLTRIMTDRLQHQENKQLHCSACGTTKRRLQFEFVYGSVELV